MEHDIKIRKAAEKDIPFLANAICEAEKSGTEILSYCKIFNISFEFWYTMLLEILAEDIEEQELCFSSFLVAECNGLNVGACAAWIEGASGKASSIIKGDILSHFLSKEILKAAKPNLEIVSKLAIERTKNYMQIESVYVNEAFRGQGIAGILIKKHAELLLQQNNQLKKAEIILTADNEKALSSYKKRGFVEKLTKKTNDVQILKLVASNARIIMEADIITLINKD